MQYFRNLSITPEDILLLLLLLLPLPATTLAMRCYQKLSSTMQIYLSADSLEHNGRGPSSKVTTNQAEQLHQEASLETKKGHVPSHISPAEQPNPSHGNL